MLSVNPLLLENRSGYYGVLRQTQGGGFVEELDVTRFIAFHTEQLMAAAVRLEERAIAFSRQRDRWVAQYGFLSTRQVTGLMFMQDIGPLSSSRYAGLTDTSQATALTDLAELLKAGLVRREGAGRNTRYRFALPSASGV
jgi:Fic family protein